VLGMTPQRRLYAGRDLARAVSIEDLRAMAHRRLPRFALEYLEGGAEDEATLARNITALTEWRFAPRALVELPGAIFRPNCLAAGWRCRLSSRRPA
jgi:(S)-mandelate dehydrogenase